MLLVVAMDASLERTSLYGQKIKDADRDESDLACIVDVAIEDAAVYERLIGHLPKTITPWLKGSSMSCRTHQ